MHRGLLVAEFKSDGEGDAYGSGAFDILNLDDAGSLGGPKRATMH